MSVASLLLFGFHVVKLRMLGYIAATGRGSETDAVVGGATLRDSETQVLVLSLGLFRLSAAAPSHRLVLVLTELEQADAIR